jgi:hypothetical protein
LTSCTKTQELSNAKEINKGGASPQLYFKMDKTLALVMRHILSKICISYIVLETIDLQLSAEIKKYPVPCIGLKFDTKEASSISKTGFYRSPPPKISHNM